MGVGGGGIGCGFGKVGPGVWLGGSAAWAASIVPTARVKHNTPAFMDGGGTIDESASFVSHRLSRLPESAV